MVLMTNANDNGRDFDATLATFCGLVAQSNKSTVTIELGRRFAKLVQSDGGSSRSAIMFVDRNTGDVFKAASWSAPAKGIRGNIFSNNPPTSRAQLYRYA